MLFFTDPRRTPMPDTTIALMPRGSGVVFRAFGSAEALSIGLRLAKVARQRGVCFLVGADAALATRLRADGVHLPERLSGRPGAIRRLQERFLVTAAAHSLPAAIRAARAGVDALVISPVFESGSPSAGRALGPRAAATLVRALRQPVYALGGVGLSTVTRLKLTGVVGFAAIDSLVANEGFSTRPEEMRQAFRPLGQA